MTSRPLDREPNEISEEWLAYTGYLVAALYLPSLCSNCIYMANGAEWQGWELLLWGWLPILLSVTDPPMFAWCANLLLPITLLLFFIQRFRLAIVAGIPCLLLASSSLLLRGITANEAGIAVAVTGYGVGFYLWWGACAVPVIMSFLFDFWARSTGNR